MTTGLSGWHPGEQSIREKLDVDPSTQTSYLYIDCQLPDQHRIFHTTRLPFLPITTLDKSGRPWTSIAAGPKGELGFISSPSSTSSRLRMNIRVWDGEPLIENVKVFNQNNKMLIAGIGIEFSTRRRNKLAGYVTSLRQDGHTIDMEVEVNEAIGNCPKYINLRDLVPHSDTHPVVELSRLNMDADERLPEDLLNFIVENDTVFFGTTYEAAEKDQKRFPSHLGQNQRGGRPGFIRVRPSDGRTVCLPDFSGNRIYTSLGNIEATPLASMTFVSFTNGDILYLTGAARTLIGAEAQEMMPRQRVLTTLHVTGFVFVRNALPVRQRQGTEVQRSPYSPPIRLLAEEIKGGTGKLGKEVTVTLTKMELHSSDLATFTWETSSPIHIRPGQTAVLDFTDLLGVAQYSHMADWKPSSINDDRIRTWTVSSSHLSPDGTRQFSLTMREKPGGLVTTALFTIARKISQLRPEILSDSRDLELRIKLVGIAGDFILTKPEISSPPSSDSDSITSMLWIAGGIGITPFISMLSAVSSSSSDDIQWDIHLLLSTREPDVLLPLISKALKGNGNPKLHLIVEIFSHNPVNVPSVPSRKNYDVSFIDHQGRISPSTLSRVPDIASRNIYLCGPQGFEDQVVANLTDLGVNRSVIKREGFNY
ncbi:hypothetical protein ABKN59_009710 [Abortiporus biennis]